eukprot:SAG11_NODE_74_length_18043_cov_13.387818_18_plen_110_part_00
MPLLPACLNHGNDDCCCGQTKNWLAVISWLSSSRQVTGCLSLMCALTTCPPPLGNFMAGCVIAATMGKHHFVDGVTPPVPVIVLNAISVLSCLAGVMSSTTRPTGKKEA